MESLLKKDIFTLVKSALSGEKLPLSKDFCIKEVAKIGKKHGVSSMIYYGAVNCGVNTSLEQMQVLFMLSCRSLAVSERQIHSINRLCSAFEEIGIDYMPLKGTLLKKLYPKSDMRNMGDADILIKTEQYDKIKPIMIELGFSEKVESDHELVWRCPELLVELHKRLIPSYNKDYYNYYGNGWQLAKPSTDNPYRFEMTDEDQMIYLFTHFAKHYRDGGIGIRHLTDLFVYRNAKPNLDEKYIKTELEKLSLLEFYLNILETLDVCFGDTKSSAKTDYIINTILESGVYGDHDKSVIATTIKTSKSQNSSRNVKIKRIFNLIFPKLELMEYHYAFLKKLPFLLSITWIMRIFKIIFFKNKKALSFYNDIKNMSVNDINDYEDSLRFVGLDFNFKE